MAKGAISCLLAKAELGRVSKKGIEQVQAIVDNLTALRGPQSAADDLRIATSALETLQKRYDQRVLSEALHMKQVQAIGERISKSTADPFRTLQSFIISDEPTLIKHGYQGLSTHEAIRNRTSYYGSKLVDLISDLNKGRPLGTKVKQVELIEHLYFKTRNAGKESLDPLIRKRADEIVSITKLGGEDYAKLGGRINIRDDFALSSGHDVMVMNKMGKEAWVKRIYPLIDLKPLTDVGLSAGNTDKFLGQVYDNIVTGGVSTFTDYLPKGLKSVANKRNHHRLIQLKDAQSWMEYHELMGKEDMASVFEAYAHNIGRDVGALETLGPKPEAFFRSMINQAREAGKPLTPSQENTLRQQFNFVLGQWDSALDPEMARLIGNSKALAASGMIGTGTVVDAVIGDAIGLTGIPKLLRGLPVLKTLQTQLKLMFNTQLKADSKELAKLGYGFEAFADEAGALFRSIDTRNTSAWASGLARFNFKITGLTRTTNVTKSANRITTANLLADAADGSLRTNAREWVKGFGLGEEDFELFKQYTKTLRGGLTVVDIPGLIDAGHSKAAHKLASAVEMSAEVGSPTSNPAIAAMFEAIKRSGKAGQFVGGSAGTFQGYLGSFWEHHFRTITAWPKPMQKMAAVGQLAVILPTMYIASTMIRDMMVGKEPVLDSETVLKGFARANVMPILGDFLFTGGQHFQGGITERIGGLQLGLLDKGFGAVKKGLSGEFGDAGQEVLSFMKGFIPGGNAWLTGLVLQRAIFDQANSMMRGNEADSAFRRQITKQNKRGGGYWWAPGDVLPEG